MTTTPPPGDPAWESIRARYEAGVEKVKDIAASIGLTVQALIAKARALGWTLRSKAKAASRKVVVAAVTAKAKSETTRATLARLKDMLQQRVAQLEAELKDIGAEVDAIKTDRQVKTVNTLVRTLEKVLDLERKDKLKRKQDRRDYNYFDAEQRRALAEKIDRLEGDRTPVGEAPEPSRGGGAEQPVALLGEARPAAATGT